MRLAIQRRRTDEREPPRAPQPLRSVDVPLASLLPRARPPVTSLPEESLTELAKALSRTGVRQPFLARRENGSFRLVAGEQRLRAASIAGLSSVPVVGEDDPPDGIRDSLVAHIRHADLSPLELAAVLRELHEELGMSHKELSGRLGRPRSYVAQTIHLLDLPQEVQRLLASRRIEAAHARALLAVPSARDQIDLAVRAAKEQMPAKRLGRIVHRISTMAPPDDDLRPGPGSATPVLRKAPGQASMGLRILLLANLLAASFYLTWWLDPSHIGTPALFYLLAAAEIFTLVQLLGFWWAMWGTRFAPPPPVTRRYAIDVLIPTRGEPIELLRSTVTAAVSMDGAHRTFILDDSGRDEVKALARSLGVGYVTRQDTRGAKAGNLNHALSVTEGELVAIFDADHAPRKDFLTRLLGYFEDPGVAFVQTPQFYENGRHNEVARGAFQQQTIFYGPICRGKNGLSSAFCCGTNVLFRRRALEDVDGFDEKSVVEDFVTSMRIHRRGWRSVYYPYVLAAGLGPANLRSYFRQQFRWARGSIGALFSLEPFKPGFSLAQRFQYLMATTFYLIGGVTLIYIALPIVYLMGGGSAFSDNSASFVFFYVPYFVLALVTLRFGLGGQLRLEHLQYTFGTFPVYALAGVISLLRLPARFRVTSKTEQEQRTRPPFLAWVSVLAFAATAAAIVFGLVIRPTTPRVTTNVAWGSVNLLLLFGTVSAVFREVFRTKGAVHGGTWRMTRTSNSWVPVQGGAIDLTKHEGHVVTVERPLVLPEHALPVPPRKTPPPPRHVALDIAVLTALALGLRLALIETQSIRLDETLTLWQTSSHGFDVWRFILYGDRVHVPLYHMIMAGWIDWMGASEWALRLPSVIFGTAAVPLLYLVGRRVVGTRAAVLAAAIGAASPFWVWHSDEARMYTLLLFLSLASMVLLFSAVEKGGWWRWALYAVLTGASFYSHYFALLMPAVHLAYLVISRVPFRKFLAWALAAGLAGLMFLPWIYFVYQIHYAHLGVGGGFADITNGLRLPEQDHSFFGAVYGVMFFLLVFAAGYGQTLGHGVGILGLLSRFAVGVWPLVALVGTMSRSFGRWMRSRAAVFLLGWLALTIGLTFIVSIWKPTMWLQRYLIIASPAVFLAIAAGLSRVMGRRLLAALLVFGVLTVATVVENFQISNPVREDFRRAAAIVALHGNPDDSVVLIPNYYVRPFNYYHEGPIKVRGVLDGERPQEVALGIDLPNIGEKHRGSALWVILSYKSAFDPDHALRRYLYGSFIRTDAYTLGGQMMMWRFLVPEGFRGNEPLPVRRAENSEVSLSSGQAL